MYSGGLSAAAFDVAELIKQSIPMPSALLMSSMSLLPPLSLGMVSCRCPFQVSQACQVSGTAFY
jgi:hypothetical protein